MVFVLRAHFQQPPVQRLLARALGCVHPGDGALRARCRVHGVRQASLAQRPVGQTLIRVMECARPDDIRCLQASALRHHAQAVWPAGLEQSQVPRTPQWRVTFVKKDHGATLGHRRVQAVWQADTEYCVEQRRSVVAMGCVRMGAIRCQLGRHQALCVSCVPQEHSETTLSVGPPVNLALEMATLLTTLAD
jgi:hypothetical protein